MINAENASEHVKNADQHQNQESDEYSIEEQQEERKDGDCDYHKNLVKRWNLLEEEEGLTTQMR